MKTIGILGGMGPVATAELYKNVIEYCQVNYGAVQDNEYPPIIMYSLPLEGTNETGIINESLVAKEFTKEIRKLEQAGADFIIIPCNTLHTFDAILRKESKIPVLSIVEEVVGKVKQGGVSKVGLLASKTTYDSKIYDVALAKEKIQCVNPTEEKQAEISWIILNIMGGNNTQKDKQMLTSIIKDMKVDYVILGCTELPVIIGPNDTEARVFDSVKILAQSAVDLARQK